MFFKRTPSITTQELESKLSQNPQILDVREPYEFSAGHIRGAKNVPLGRIKDYKPNGTVYVICASGMRSMRGTKQLRAKGFDAINVKGGMMSWRGAVKR
jgi:rhodanese-related sulfurtransferase